MKQWANPVINMKHDCLMALRFILGETFDITHNQRSHVPSVTEAIKCEAIITPTLN